MKDLARQAADERQIEQLRQLGQRGRCWFESRGDPGQSQAAQDGRQKNKS
jgi:hypothetical protein